MSTKLCMEANLTKIEFYATILCMVTISDQIKCHLHIHVCEIILKLILYVKYFFHIRMWGLGLSLYVMLSTIVYIILLLLYMVGSVVFGQFRQLQKNQTKSMIHPSLTWLPHVTDHDHMSRTITTLWRTTTTCHGPRPRVTDHDQISQLNCLYHIS